ncbi:MAG: KH domain-containing protein [Desulfobacteraceae bacterium]
MRKIIETIAQALVDQPEQVVVREVGGIHTTILELKVAKLDVGKVVGKRGRIAKALRIILNAVSTKEKKRTVLEILG